MVVIARNVGEPIEGRLCVLPLVNIGFLDNSFVNLVKDLLTYFAFL